MRLPSFLQPSAARSTWSSASIVLLLTTLTHPTAAVFADEAYDVDFQHQLLGLPLPTTTFFHRARPDERASLLYTLSDLGVLGAVNPGTGAIVWRHALDDRRDGRPSFLRAMTDRGVVVSAVGGARVHAWDAASGREVWNVGFDDAVVRDLEPMETADAARGNDVLLLTETAAAVGVLRRLDGRSGDVVWQYADESADRVLQVSTNVKSVFVVALHGAPATGYNLKVSSIDTARGVKVDEYVLTAKADVEGAGDVMFVGANTASPIVAWTDKAKTTLKVNVLGTKNIHSLPLGGASIQQVTIHAPQLVQSQPHFLVHSQAPDAHWAAVYHINIESGSVTEAYRVDTLAGPAAFAVSSDFSNVYFTRFTRDTASLFSSTSAVPLSQWPLDASTAAPLHGASEVVVRAADQTYALRSAVLDSEDEWALIRNGEVAWSRPEGLSGAVAAEWADIPETADLVETLEAEAHSTVLAAYVSRVKRHFDDLQHLPAFISSLPHRILSSFFSDSMPSSDSLLRDSFGLHKLAIAVTRRGRLFAIDVGSKGAVAWSKQVFDLPAGETLDVKGIFVDPKKSRVTVVDASGAYHSVDILTGEQLEMFKQNVETPVMGSVAMFDDETHHLLIVDADGHTEPTLKDMAPKEQLVVKTKEGSVKGIKYLIDGERALPTTMWTFTPPENSKLHDVVARNAHDPVASIGRVLGDRSVMYKYLNPNTVLVITVGTTSNTASIFVLDTISGDILYSTIHHSVDTTQPIPAVMSENWFAYSLWGDLDHSGADATPAKGYQLIVSDLYESPLANDRGSLGDAANFSSVYPSDAEREFTAPHAVSKSYVLSEMISQMTVTQTRQGITTKQLLAVLPRTHGLAAIPRNVLEPRRVVGRDPVAAELEEGLSKYLPTIELDPKMDLTHTRDVLVDKVTTSAALLESTCLVFAFGVDLFSTRVAPSMAFDILGRGFNKLSLIATVVALAAGVFVLAPMVRRKQINARWR